MLRRETIIALRARHEAFRVARNVEHPHLDVRPPVAAPAPKPTSAPRAPATERRTLHYEPALRWQDYDEPPPPPRMNLFGFEVWDVVAVIIGLTAVAAAMLFAVRG